VRAARVTSSRGARVTAAAAAAALVAVVTFATPRAAHAAGTDLSDQSASASGTAGAATARSGDPSAAYFNPAALVDGQGLRVGLGSTFALASLSASSTPSAPPPAFSESSETSLRAIPYLAASYSHQWFAAGVSAHVPFGGAVSWPKAWPLRFEAVESSQRVIRVAPFLGARWRAVAIAAGPQFDFGSLEVRRATNHVLEEGSVHLLETGSAVSAQAALFVQPLDTLAFGLSYKSRSTIALGGDADFTVPPTFAAQYPDQGVSSRLRLPDRIALGAAWSALPTTRLFADVTYTTWSNNDALVFDFEQGQTPDSRIRNEWRDTVAVRLGAEDDVTGSLTVRGGVFVDGLAGPAAPARNLAPSSPDMTRLGGSLGAGWKLTSGVALDAFYSLVGLLERASTSDDYPLASYGGSAHLFGLGARFAWSPSP